VELKGGGKYQQAAIHNYVIKNGLFKRYLAPPITNTNRRPYFGAQIPKEPPNNECSNLERHYEKILK
jgi:hypothetical protein